MLDKVAESLGSTEAALRLAITLFAAYAFAAVYRLKLTNASVQTKHYYLIACGVSVIMFNYGFDVKHSMFSILVAYLTCKFIGGTSHSVIFAFVFYMGYLMAGYYFTSTDSYDILWTTSQCVMTMRLIGMITDMYDGHQKPIPHDAVESGFEDRPSLVEIAAYTYFYGSCMVGPQFSLRRFRDFINNRFEEPHVQQTDRVKIAMGRLALGIAYMATHVWLTMYYPTEYFLTDEFKSENILKKWINTLIWFRVILFRYQSVWLLAEGSCILSGLAYNGQNEKGENLWDAVRNIRMVKFEFGASFQSIIESFNYNTNQWAAKYVFKRLRFLGNKELSQILTLAFLAVWHGFKDGYFACFAFEFFCVLSERQLWSVLQRNNTFNTFSRTPELMFPLWVVKKLAIMSGCAFGLIPFALLNWERWVPVYTSIYFIGWIIVISVIIISSLVKPYLIDGNHHHD